MHTWTLSILAAFGLVVAGALLIELVAIASGLPRHDRFGWLLLRCGLDDGRMDFCLSVGKIKPWHRLGDTAQPLYPSKVRNTRRLMAAITFPKALW